MLTVSNARRRRHTSARICERQPRDFVFDIQQNDSKFSADQT